MRSTFPRLVLPSILALLLVPVALPGPSRAGEEAPETVVVQKRPFAVHLDLTGTFVPHGAEEITYQAEVYGGALEVVEAVGAGPVVAGQHLVQFAEEDIRLDIQNAERDLYIARTRLEKQEAEYRQREVRTKLDVDRLGLVLARAEEELTHFREVERPDRIERSLYNLQGTEDRLTDQREELEQLVKMYEADDLTEETEEIVIRRTKRGLARQEKAFEWQKKGHEELLAIELPRKEQDLVQDVERKRIDFETFKITGAADLRRTELELDKARDDFARQEKRLADLKADRDGLRLRSPIDGIAVPGKFHGTSWSDIEGSQRALEKGAKAKAGQVLFTVLKPGHVDVATSVGESDLLKVKVGQTVTVRPGIDESVRLAGVVSAVLPVGEKGKYDVSIDLKETDPRLLPGYGCKLQVAVESFAEALVVPAAAVGRGEGGRSVVYVIKDGKPTATPVEVGSTADGRTRIVSGVEAGATVLAKAPEASK